MLEGRKVEHIIIAGGILHEGLENVRTAINGESSELSMYIAKGATDIPDKLNHIVLGNIDNMENLGFSPENFLGYGLPNGTSTANNEKPGIFDNVVEFIGIILNIGLKKIAISSNQVKDAVHIMSQYNTLRFKFPRV
jgi:hypothetical protein